MLICSCNTKSGTNQNSNQEGNMENIAMNFSLKRSERSKDSNDSKVQINISNQVITISRFYGGRDPRKNTRKEIKINSKIEVKIIQFLKENELDKDLEEHQKTDGIGIAKALILTIDYPFQSKISIEGKTTFWGASNYPQKKGEPKVKQSRTTNLQNIVYFEKASSFVSFIENLQ